MITSSIRSHLPRRTFPGVSNVETISPPKSLLCACERWEPFCSYLILELNVQHLRNQHVQWPWRLSRRTIVPDSRRSIVYWIKSTWEQVSLASLSYRLMKTLQLCWRILSTLSFIFSFSANSNSATLATESTRTREPNIFTLSVSIGVFAIRIRAFSMRSACWCRFVSPRENLTKKQNSDHRWWIDQLITFFQIGVNHVGS